ncbi:MAG: lysine--tRNA ligase [Candidatus Sungbacteria bacterium RIFCSPHIGHO2_02_FULL_49_12]|uniref:Lysine--tRNA ligase n=1 Tax=Candidatus Sungbacteria bacterium RIFCSPHIGHO2_02_FULL_49_12 TaxID=1802271 RepID=A0A1G2KNK9_9BACT|nr:MAG: lysine--tRNA ligase [Candidatus Sungbacteria bacterium RIFCSPHIGHO2_02_FULL_49_12]
MPLEDIRAERVKKLDALRAMRIDPYPAETRRSFPIGTLMAEFAAHEAEAGEVFLAGRLMALREHGGATFGDMRDESGTIQVLFKKDIVGDTYDALVAALDIGDIIEVSGKPLTTQRGEKTIQVEKARMLTKSLRPLPEKWHGLVDVEERLRRRYLGLLMDPDERELFRKKSQFWQAIRSHMLSQGFLEVETPVLESTPGGADAEPFFTHLNALDIDLYLRISLELPLKRLIVGGYEKVFEIGRIFRNEGIVREHLQDYTQLEFYWAYADYRALMPFVGSLYRSVIKETLGNLSHSWNGETIDWSPTWPEIDYYDVFKKETGLDLTAVSDDALQTYAGSEGIDVSHHIGRGWLIDAIFKKKVRPTFIQPAFLVLPPVEVEPLAKRWREDVRRVERFQVVACASELGKGFSELNDPLDQRARFEEQEKLRKAGDTEAQRLDEDFVEALEYGMPPTAGFGVSERLFSVIMDKPVRETVFFPLMRPRQ